MTKRMRRLDEDLGLTYQGRVLSNNRYWFVVHRCWNQQGTVYFDTDRFSRQDMSKYLGSQRVYLHEANKYKIIEPSKVPEFLKNFTRNLRR